jgi:hypothetical protein
MIENKKNQSHITIDDLIENAIENAEARRELSEAELNGVLGGTGGKGTDPDPIIFGRIVVVTTGIISQDPPDKLFPKV